MKSLACEPLAKHHNRIDFDCGIQELNEYLNRQAGQDVRRRAAAVFVLVSEDEPDRIAGYYALSSASVALVQLPIKFTNRLPRDPEVPAALLGRLARAATFPGTDKLLLLDALQRSLEASHEVASAVVLVDAKNEMAREFYRRSGIHEVLHSPRRLFLPMATVETLLRASP